MAEESMLDIIQTIKKECTCIVGDCIASDSLLFRGIKGVESIPHISLRPIRQFCSLDYQSIDNVVNKHLKKRGYLERQNVSFASSIKSTADSYGDCFYCFPVDGFKYSFASDVFDLYINFEKWLRDDYEYVTKGLPKNLILDSRGDLSIIAKYCEWHPCMRKCINDHYLSGIEFIKDDLSSALKKGLEIWFSGCYHLIPSHLLTKDELFSLLKD